MVKAAAPPELQPIAALPQGSFVKAICGYAVLMARLVRTAAKTSSLMNRARRSDRVSYSRPRSLFFAIVATVFNGNRDERWQPAVLVIRDGQIVQRIAHQVGRRA